MTEEKLQLARDWYNDNMTTKKEKIVLEELFPELHESKDERIRKAIIELVKQSSEVLSKQNQKEMIAYLEKQCDQDNNEDMDILHRFSFYSYKDEPNVLYLSGLYVNEEYRNKGIGTKILKIADKVSASMDCNYIRLKTESGDAERLYKENGYNTLKKEGNQVWLEKQRDQKAIEQDTEIHDLWVDIREWNDKFGRLPKDEDELASCIDYVMKRQKPANKIEQNTAWSEDDERMIETIIYDLERHGGKEDSSYSAEINYLKSIKEIMKGE